jgi:hypothetical protein
MVMTNNNVATPGSLDFAHLEALIGGGLGRFDLPCPVCSPHRRKSHEKCFAIWHEQADFLPIAASTAICAAMSIVVDRHGQTRFTSLA